MIIPPPDLSPEVAAERFARFEDNEGEHGITPLELLELLGFMIKNDTLDLAPNGYKLIAETAFSSDVLDADGNIHVSNAEYLEMVDGDIETMRAGENF